MLPYGTNALTGDIINEVRWQSPHDNSPRDTSAVYYLYLVNSEFDQHCVLSKINPTSSGLMYKWDQSPVSTVLADVLPVGTARPSTGIMWRTELYIWSCMLFFLDVINFNFFWLTSWPPTKWSTVFWEIMRQFECNVICITFIIMSLV